MSPAMRLLLIALLSLPVLPAFSQRNNAKPPATVPQKAKPKLKTSWGAYSDSATITVDEARNLASALIKVTDDKKVNYTVTTYQLAYRRFAVTEDETTGKVTPTSSLVAKQFAATPLSEVWIRQLNEQLRPGEELYLFDIVVKDAQGKLYFAPELKIKTK